MSTLGNGRLLGVHQFGEQLNVSDIVSNARRRGTLLDPDVIIGFTDPRPLVLWTADRVLVYGVTMGYLNDDGSRAIRGTNVKTLVPDPLPTWWSADTVRYASIGDVGKAWGMTVQAARERSRRGELGPPDIVVDHVGRYPKPGFLPATVVREGRQRGFSPRARWLKATLNSGILDRLSQVDTVVSSTWGKRIGPARAGP